MHMSCDPAPRVKTRAQGQPELHSETLIQIKINNKSGVRLLDLDLDYHPPDVYP